ncbi:acyl-CoA ligase (AMP-forming), exosortase A-associated [Nitrosomonas sp. Nm51]|uniref:acyl-CoA ligase (AMP-forming), exosortase A system-associated n=1 Tax=Nitrosomonas sp. Nm51 TaxID=133720 RepID=UPI0008AEAC03|nr:acyl-CoA ligase (AMP-forming), exosortase A system-associated [Nitrosomonas sp. Nm51]SER75146.1 acyl-CoA ligase (AMP-forming), exosortase A-associated [Nitrosomonas sp. Nm51]
MVYLVHDLINHSAHLTPDVDALSYQGQKKSYEALASEIEQLAAGFFHAGLGRSERLAVYLEKRLESVSALFAANAAGGVFVPVNPLLKPEQVGYILADCNVRILVTSTERLKLLTEVLPSCHDLHTVITIDNKPGIPEVAGLNILNWADLHSIRAPLKSSRVIDGDMAAILYTSGSTGKPKGVVLSHRNIVTGAKSVAQYLQNEPNDRILSVLPLSFDYGLSQLTTAFHVGATNVLMNYLLPRDIIRTVEKENISGLAAVPPLWIQLAQLNWENAQSLRYITNSGGAMPRATLDLLGKALPRTRIFLMYGLTEAFRSTYLPPEEIGRRPDSIGQAIPNAEILVLREDGSHCAPGEPGELVHRGALVSMGYWNDSEKTAACFKPIISRQNGLTLPELAVWSGDTVRMDEAGFLYFIGRRDEMIKTSGYRVSPTEIEEILYATEKIGETVAIGLPHPVLGQAILVIATPRDGASLDAADLLAACKQHLPAYMLPSYIDIRQDSLPRSPNGKIDRKKLFQEMQNQFIENNS